MIRRTERPDKEYRRTPFNDHDSTILPRYPIIIPIPQLRSNGIRARFLFPPLLSDNKIIPSDPFAAYP